MEIVSPVWQRQYLPKSELLDDFRQHGVRYAIVDTTSNKDGAPRYFVFHEPVREVFSAGSLRIVDVSPTAAAPAAARAP
jgi:hypothetical protein